MRKEEYMKCLAKRLKKLPKRDFDMAMEYFEEYFEEAGPDREEQAILDLGTPEEAASQIIVDIAARNGQEKGQKSLQRGFSAVWVGILAVLAAPVGIPLAASSIVLAGRICTFDFNFCDFKRYLCNSRFHHRSRRWHLWNVSLTGRRNYHSGPEPYAGRNFSICCVADCKADKSGIAGTYPYVWKNY